MIPPPYAPSPESPPSDACALLSLDGGGVRGIFAILFLIALQTFLPTGLDIRDILHLMGGTSTGGIAAILYGRLNLSLEECLEIYKEIPRKMFGRSKVSGGAAWIFSSAQYSQKKRRRIFEKILKERCGNTELLLRCEESPTPGRCPVFVVAVDTENVLRPTVFSSYSQSDNRHTADISIVSAALATSAAPVYFQPEEYNGHSYIDGGIGFNNPSEIAMKELTGLYGPGAFAHTFISLGTGNKTSKAFERRRNGLSGLVPLLRTFVSIATASEDVHERMEERLGGRRGYYRFDPPGLEDIALDDWRSMDTVISLSRKYLSARETKSRMKELAARLVNLHIQRQIRI